MSIMINSLNQVPPSYSPWQSPYIAPVEYRILDLQKAGKNEMEIAKELDLSLTEVHKRLEAIKRKIDQKSDENNVGEKK